MYVDQIFKMYYIFNFEINNFLLSQFQNNLYCDGYISLLMRSPNEMKTRLLSLDFL